MLDYIYSEQASQYAYYRIPKILFTDDRYRDISTDAKVLYGLLLDRVSLSIKNKWVDDQNRVFIIFSLADVQESLNCGPQKATALFRELEKKAGLIERKRQGLGKPNLIYVKNFCEAPRESAIPSGLGILRNSEGVELMPANIELSGLEVSLVNAMSRETILRQYLDTVKRNYDVILIDCSPSLGMLTVNALAAADSVIIPVQAQYLSAKGLEQLLGTINRVKRQINPKLRIEGVLLTMVDSRTNYGRDISSLIRDTYGGKLRVFDAEIPRSVRAEEISAEGKSIFAHDPRGKVADAYRALTKEVLSDAEKRRKRQLEQLR